MPFVALFAKAKKIIMELVKQNDFKMCISILGITCRHFKKEVALCLLARNSILYFWKGGQQYVSMILLPAKEKRLLLFEK